MRIAVTGRLSGSRERSKRIAGPTRSMTVGKGLNTFILADSITIADHSILSICPHGYILELFLQLSSLSSKGGHTIRKVINEPIRLALDVRTKLRYVLLIRGLFVKRGLDVGFRLLRFGNVRQLLDL